MTVGFFRFCAIVRAFFLQIQRCYMTVFVLRDFYVSLCTYVSGVRMMGNTGFWSLLGSEIHEAISPPPPSPPLLPWRDSMEKRLEEKRRERKEEKPTTFPFSPHIISNIRENIWETWNRLFLSLLTFSSRPFGIFLDIPPVFPHKHPFLKCHNHLAHVLLSSRNNLQHLLSLSHPRSTHDNKQAPPTRDLTNEFFSIFVAFCAIAQKATRTFLCKAHFGKYPFLKKPSYFVFPVHGTCLCDNYEDFYFLKGICGESAVLGRWRKIFICHHPMRRRPDGGGRQNWGVC